LGLATFLHRDSVKSCALNLECRRLKTPAWNTAMKSRSVISQIAYCAGLIVPGMCAFWPSMGFSFVNWDDVAYVEHNQLIQEWSAENLTGIATQTVTRNYAPLTIFSFLVDHTLWDMNAGGYHATNVLLHVLNGVLVYLLLCRLTGSRFVAWTAAALFLVHPVQIESVAWISSRKGLLCAAFMLGACIARLRPDVQPKHDGWYIGLLIAALLSKALAVVLPPIVLTYDVCVRKIRFSDAAVRQVIPAFFSVLLLLHTIGAQNSVMGGVRGHMDLPLWHIVAIDVTILWRYIGMLIWPSELCVLYAPATTGIAAMVAIGAVAWITIATVLWRGRHRWPLAMVGAASFLLLLFPVLNFFRITTLMNDRYLYLPCIPIFAGAAWCAAAVFRAFADSEQSVFRWIATAVPGMAALTAVAASLLVTSGHIPVWRNSLTLWTQTQQRQPDIPVVRIQMALTLHDIGQTREAVRTMSLALVETQPDEGDRRRMTTAIERWKTELTQ
jgi:protein O-mannosyl-transferase